MAIGGGLGDAYIRVHADTDPFARELAASRGDADAILNDIGKNWGEELSSATAKEINKHGPDFARAIEDSVAKETVHVRSKVDYYNVRDSKGRFTRRIAQDIEEDVREAFDSATRPGGPFSKIGEGIADAIGAGFNVSGRSPLIAVLIPAVGAIVGLVVAAAQAINVLAGLLTTLPALIAGVGAQAGVLIIAFQGIGKAVSSAFAAKNAKELKEAIKGLTPAAQTFVKGLLPLKGFFESLQKLVQQNFFRAFGNAIPSVIKFLGPEFFTGMGQLASAMGAAFREILGVLNHAEFHFFLHDLFPATIHWLSLFAPAFAHLLEAFTLMGDAALPLLTFVGDWVSLNLDSFASFIEDVVKSGKFQEWLLGLQETFDKVMGVLIDFLKLVGALIDGLDQAGANQVLDTFMEALNQLIFFLNTPVGKKALEGLIDISIISIKSITGVIEIILSLIAAAEYLGELIKNWLVPGFVVGLKTIGDAVIWGLTAVGNFFIWLGNKIRELWNFIVKHSRDSLAAIGERIATVINFVHTIPDKILAAVANFGNLLYNAGVNLIKGLIRGIQDHIPSLKGILGWVTNILPDWKGPEDKDRQILYPAGRAVMTGFVTGINAGKSELRDALTGITQSLAGSGTSTTNTQNVTFGPDAIRITFMGNPTEEQAYNVGRAVGAGINNQVASRNVTVGIRRM